MGLKGQIRMDVDVILRKSNQMSPLTTKDDRRYLISLIALLQEKSANIVEIGVYYGASALAIKEAMIINNIDGKLHLIDIFRYPISDFKYHKPLRMCQIQKTECYREVVAKTISEAIIWQAWSDDVPLGTLKPISFLFLDGDHSVHGCLLDLLKYSQLAPQIIALHDNWSPKVIKAIDFFLEIRDEYTIMGEQGNITALSK